MEESQNDEERQKYTHMSIPFSGECVDEEAECPNYADWCGRDDVVDEACPRTCGTCPGNSFTCHHRQEGKLLLGSFIKGNNNAHRLYFLTSFLSYIQPY